MRIAILSDIHDNVWKLAAALHAIRDADAMICCGDLCSPFVVHQMGRGFPRPIHIVYGNNDGDQTHLAANARRYDHVRIHGDLMRMEFEGKKFAMNHYDSVARELAKAEEFDVVCYGHTHVFEMSRIGKTLAVNPGAIMGAAFAPDGTRTDVPSTYVIYETITGHAAQFEVR